MNQRWEAAHITGKKDLWLITILRNLVAGQCEGIKTGALVSSGK